MKKILMVAITLIASVSVFSQKTSSTQVINKSVNKQTSNITGYYGLNKVIGFDFAYGKGIMYGLGVSMYVGRQGVGENYSNTMGPNTFSSEIYEKITAKNVGLYGIVGYRATKNLIVQGKLGYGGNIKYFNAYDKRQILSPNGYYYTSQDAGGSLLFGGSLQYVIDNISPYVGYDNYNGLKIGVGYNF
jgi:hypothetical protein